ncbi:MAG: FAD:protein FMN transferase [Desulfobacterales bacterium]|nr:FAD:protein FMN transferase [Desulfobacterales bacterium]
MARTTTAFMRASTPGRLLPSMTPQRVLVIAFILIAIAGCSGQREIRIAGRTMGTTYHITVIGGYLTSVAQLKKAIDARLEAINASMSTYRPESVISRFNRFQETETAFPVDADFYRVATLSKELFDLTAGAWDGTIDPLVDLWGFGRSQRPARIPSDAEIDAALARVGFDLIDTRRTGALIKRHAGVTLDLASVAKGYGVDAVAELIRQRGFTDFLVEVGGEVYAAGTRLDGGRWRIGINRPEPGAPTNQVYKVVALQDRAFATSGDYRIFFEQDGQRFSHVIDPRTGRPVTNRVVSVSVTAATCARADGLATALMVMGADEGLKLVNALNDTDCLIVVRDAKGHLVDHYSKRFRQYTEATG